MEARDHPNCPAQIFAWRKEVRARLIADRLSIDPADRRQYAGKIALHLSHFIEPLSKRTVSFYWPFRGEPDLRPLMQTVVEGGGRCGAPGRCREKSSTCLSPLETWRKTLQPAFGNIPIPADGPDVLPDIVVAPVVGFDSAGYRLGYGGWLLRSYTSELTPSLLRHRRRI